MQHVLKPLELDRPVHPEVGPGSAGHFAAQADVDEHRSLDRGRIDPRDHPLDHPVPCVNVRPLPDCHVVDQCLRDLELRLEVRRIGDPRQFVARRDQLAYLDIHHLQDAVQPGPDTEPVNLLLAQHNQSLHLLDACLLGL